MHSLVLCIPIKDKCKSIKEIIRKVILTFLDIYLTHIPLSVISMRIILVRFLYSTHHIDKRFLNSQGLYNSLSQKCVS